MPDPQTILAESLAGRYTIVREVGAGGMATVYLADDVRHRRKVALKVLRPDLAATLGPDRFVREIAIAANLQHPHVLPLYDSGEAGGFLFYVMPYVDGMSLRDRLLQAGELPVSDAVRILRDIADALAYAHGHGVVHRDIKPENVMLSGRHALVTDFGVAKAVSEATGRQQLTTVGVALGTPAYMAPEQATADPHTDHRADIYAFGALAYELLTGRPPFVGTTPQSVLAAHVTTAVEPVTQHRPSIPPVLAGLIMKCLEKKPADRWQSADELIPQLEGVLTPSGGTTPTQLQPASRPRRRWPLVAGAAALAVAGGFAVVMTRTPAPAVTGTNLVLVVPFENATGDASRDALASVLETAIKEGLQRTGLAEVLDSRAAYVTLGTEPAEDVATSQGARRLAEATGASLIVTGRYLPTADSLQIEASLVDVSASLEPARIRAERVPLAAPARALEPLVQRIMGALAVAIDPRWGVKFVPGLQAPSYDSYREYRTGISFFDRRRYDEAALYFGRAFAMEPGFYLYAVREAYALNNAGDCAKVDSIGRALNVVRSAISEYEGYYLDRVLAWCAGDYEAALHAARSMARVAPKSPYAKYLSARSAIFVNRQEEAVAELLAGGVGVMEEQSPDAYYRDLSRAHHLLEHHDRALKVTAEWLADPRALRPFEAASVRLAQAAALGTLDSVPPLLNRMLTSTGEADGVLAALLSSALELSWHGHRSEAQRVATSVLDRLGSQSPRQTLLSAQFVLEQFAMARALADSLVTVSGSTLDYRGWQGALAAREGDRAAAEAADAWLRAFDDRYRRSAALLWRARIRAQLGENSEAVRLAREAYGAGAHFLTNFHPDPLLEPIRDDAAFREFLRPKS